MAVPLANPFPAGPRFIHNTQRKDVNAPQPAPPVSVTAPVVAREYKTVYITDEARDVARHLGIRASAVLVQRVLNAEATIVELAARLDKLEGK